MMTSDDRARIRQVIQHIKLHDLFLYESAFTRGEDPDGGLPDTVLMEDMRRVEAAQMPYPDGGEGTGLVQIKITLGSRAVPDNGGVDGDPEPAPLFTIEASFIVEYLTDEVLDDESIRVFANINGVHNVWPFWRQHVNDVVDRGRLPRIVIPLFSADP
ncbi:MAG: hypothetical protein ACPGU7_05115 [Gammaproteobacteria bacterium]